MKQVYYNLRRKVFSIQENGRVVRHAEHVLVEGARFVVQPAGRQRVLTTGRKNVHAFVRGTVRVLAGPPRSVEQLTGSSMKRVHYNPFKAATFVTDDGKAVTGALRCYLGIQYEKPVMYADWV